MARVSGPLMSMEASGTYGKTLTFGKWKGRPYVRERVDPSNPKTASQTGVRVMMKFLARAWAALTAGNKTTWDALAASRSISAFNAYVSANLTRWQEFKGPTEANPAAATLAAPAIASQTLTGDVGSITVAATVASGTGVWGFAIFRSSAAIVSTNWNNCVGIISNPGGTSLSFVDSPLTAGTYHYRVAALTTDGNIGTAYADGTAVAS